MEHNVFNQSIIRQFSNMGRNAQGRNFAGFQDSAPPGQYYLQPRGCLRISLKADDIVMLGDPVWPDAVALANGHMEIFDSEGNLVSTLRITGEGLERWLEDAPVESETKLSPESE